MAGQFKPLVGVGGVLIAAAAAELNDDVVAVAIRDVAGGLGLSHDPGTWLTSLYVSAECVGMALSPWLLGTFTLRQFTLFVILLNATSTLLIPVSPDLASLYLLRALQGLSGGLTIPLLLTSALRVLQPSVKLYGLAIYALTATFFPNLAGPLNALWMTKLGWQLLLWDTLPLCAAAAVLVWWGLPQDEPNFARLRLFDWRGALLVLVGLGSFTTMLQQGDRYDWFNSRVMGVLGLASLVCLPALVVNEWFHPLPLLKIQLLKRVNLAYGLIALVTFLIISQSSSTVPYLFLQEVGDFRPGQIWVLTGLIAAAQLVLLPLAAFILDHPAIDVRLVHGAGLALILLANVGASLVTGDWNRNQLLLWQALQAVGQPLVIMSLLMMATNEVKGPDEAPFASALVNTPRAVAEAVGVWLLQLITRWRGALHYNRLADQAGQLRFGVLQRLGISPERAVGPDRAFGELLREQAMILTFSDIFLILAGVAAGLIVLLCLMARRTPPPRVLAQQE